VFKKGSIEYFNYSYQKKMGASDQCQDTNPTYGPNLQEIWCCNPDNQYYNGKVGNYCIRHYKYSEYCPNGCKDGACIQGTTPPIATSTPPVSACQTITIGNSRYRLEPCNIKAEMIDGSGNKNFNFTIVQEGEKTVYGFTVYGYGVRFPTYGILGGYSSGGARGSLLMNKYFNDNVLRANGMSPMRYSGYLPIKIYHGSAIAANQKELRLNINLLVNSKTVSCPKPYHVLTSDNRCVWSCGTGTTPNNANNECVCKPGFAQYGVDQFGRRICREVIQTTNSLY